MQNKSFTECVSELVRAGEALIELEETSSFDTHLEQFIASVEQLLPEIPPELSPEEVSVLRRFAEVHQEVTELTDSARADVAQRLKALERNRPALVKYWINRKK